MIGYTSRRDAIVLNDAADCGIDAPFQAPAICGDSASRSAIEHQILQPRKHLFTRVHAGFAEYPQVQNAVQGVEQERCTHFQVEQNDVLNREAQSSRDPGTDS